LYLLSNVFIYYKLEQTTHEVAQSESSTCQPEIEVSLRYPWAPNSNYVLKWLSLSAFLASQIVHL